MNRSNLVCFCFQANVLHGISLDNRSNVPLYRQLYEQIATMVQGGMLLHGDRLPPTRELAGQLGLNRTTVSAAYELLEADGLIQGHVGRGSFVHYVRDEPAAPDPGLISFASSRPAASEFPIEDFQACCREAANGAGAASILQLGSPAGYGPLRRYLIERGAAEGCVGEDDDVAVTNGCQQALDLIARALIAPGATVAVEDPVYHGLKQAFQRAGATLAGVPAGQRGMDVERLARVAASERPRLIAVTPNFQNPTGGTLPAEGRRAVLDIAARHGAVIVEIDLYGQLRYTGENLPSIKSMDRSGSTVLIRSFSKIAFPGLRVGWVAGPAKLIGELTAARQWCDLHTDQLSQAILWRFAVSGRLEAHIGRVREAGRRRVEAVTSACERHLPAGSVFTHPEGGMNLWVRLGGGLDASELLPDAERAGVTYLPGSFFAVSHPDPAALRLSFGGLSPAEIRKGVEILGRAARVSRAAEAAALV